MDMSQRLCFLITNENATVLIVERIWFNPWSL